jgi:hypothetical protein
MDAGGDPNDLAMGAFGEFADRFGNWLPGGEAKFKRWVQESAPALDELGLKGMFDDVDEAMTAMKDAHDNLTAFDKQMKSSVFGKFASGDIDSISALMRRPNFEAELDNILNTIAREGGEQADMLKKSLSASFSEHLSGKMARYLGAGIDEPKFGNIVSFMLSDDPAFRKERAVMRKLFTPEQVGNLQKAAKISRDAINIEPFLTGKTAQLTDEAAKQFEKIKDTALGNIYLSLVGGTIQSPTAMTARMTKRVFSAFKDLSLAESMQQVFEKMLVDPEFAKDMMKKMPKQPEKSGWFNRALYKATTGAIRTEEGVENE